MIAAKETAQNLEPRHHVCDVEIKRSDRNELEKKRRNQFNGLIDELAECIADRCTTKRSTEKSSILRLTIEYFREQEIVAPKKAAKEDKEPFGSMKPVFVTDDEFSFVFLESSLAFVFAVDKIGNLIYTSDSVLNGVGHMPSHVLQRNIFEFIHVQDHFIFQGLLSALRSDNQFQYSSGGNGRNLAQRFEPFSCHFRRGSYGKGSDLQRIHCFGTILRNLPKEKVPNLDVSDCLLVLAKPLIHAALNTTILRSDGPQRKFTATLNIEAKYDYLDKRVASVLGFFPSELIGNSLYEFCHHEDLEDLVEYHKILLFTGSITTCHYRHLTKGQSWVWLRSQYHLSYSDWSAKPQALTCLSWVVPYEEVCLKQGEILACDRQKFDQIRAGLYGSTDGKSTSLDNWTVPVVTSPDSASAITVEKSSVSSGAKRNTDDYCSPSVASVARTVGSKDSEMSRASYNDGLMEIDLTELEGFLQKVQVPEDVTTAQHDLHIFLSRMYMQLISAINKQREELGNIQKQIKLQGEVRDLVERLGEIKARNNIEEEYSTTREIREKFEEIRRICAGSSTKEPEAESSGIFSKRLQEIGVEKGSHDQQVLALLERDQLAYSEVQQQQDRPPMQEEQTFLPQRQPVIFFNQEQRLQTQAQQAQLQLRNTQYLPQEQVMTLLSDQHQQHQQQLEQISPRNFQQQQQQQLQVNQAFLSQEQINQSFVPQSAFISSNAAAIGSESLQGRLPLTNESFSSALRQHLSISLPPSPPIENEMPSYYSLPRWPTSGHP